MLLSFYNTLLFFVPYVHLSSLQLQTTLFSIDALLIITSTISTSSKYSFYILACSSPLSTDPTYFLHHCCFTSVSVREIQYFMISKFFYFFLYFISYSFFETPVLAAAPDIVTSHIQKKTPPLFPYILFCFLLVPTFPYNNLPYLIPLSSTVFIISISLFAVCVFVPRFYYPSIFYYYYNFFFSFPFTYLSSLQLQTTSLLC